MAEPVHPTMLPPAHAGGSRDELVDLLRSLATTTVVLWHWVFTILVWRSNGPHAGNPIGYVSGLWSLTWVLQVMPLFFVAGGFDHARVWAHKSLQLGSGRHRTDRRFSQSDARSWVQSLLQAGRTHYAWFFLRLWQ